MNLIQSYFFVPAYKPKYLKKSLELKGLDYRIFDFEDSVSASNIESAISTVKVNKVQVSDWVRIPVNDQFLELAFRLYELGLKNVVVPKVRDKEHFEYLLKQLLEVNADVKVIILIENALIFLQLEEILKKWKKHIAGIGLGSHDFSAVTRIRHNTRELFPLRLQISLLANAYGVIPIDIASMNISDEEGYNTEVQSAFDLGYRAKFVLHPFQLQQLRDYSFFSKEEVNDAEQILVLFRESEEKNEVVLKYKGKIYEKPHVGQLKNIVEWGKEYYGTDR